MYLANTIDRQETVYQKINNLQIKSSSKNCAERVVLSLISLTINISCYLQSENERMKEINIDFNIIRIYFKEEFYRCVVLETRSW